MLLRVSTVGPERGAADSQRDVRGWAMKIFTEEGNQDFVFNDIVGALVLDCYISTKIDCLPMPSTSLSSSSVIQSNSQV